MAVEYKSMPQLIDRKKIDGRIVPGIFAVNGNIDDGMDRSFPGFLADFLVRGRSRVKFLWQHNPMEPPIAKIIGIRELQRADLPRQVLDYAPDATGGYEVMREYFTSGRAQEVFEAVTDGAIEEMSYAYEPTDYKYEVVEGREIRNIYKADLYDISDVVWGMNPATIAAKRMPLAEQSEMALAAVKAYIDRLQDLSTLRAKEGRVLSGENRKRIETALETLQSASAALRDLLAASDPQKAQAETQRLYKESMAIMAGLRQGATRL